MSTETKKEIISWIVFIFLAALTALAINRFIIFNANVPTGSMERTIIPGDRIIGFRPTYLFSDPERFDIVIFKFPDNEKEYLIKRIIGMPGERVEVIDGLVYINGSKTSLDDSFIYGVPYDDDWGPFDVPENSYFMMGDNRQFRGSFDSRMWDNHYVSRDKIMAKAYFRAWPNPTMLK